MGDHKLAFRRFLEGAQDNGWLSSYEWFHNDSFVLLRDQMRSHRKSLEQSSSSHKKATDGSWWGIVAEAEYGTSIGVDLELFIERPILNEPEWLISRLGLSRKTSPKELLEDWACREACYKCLAPDNEGLYLSQFRKESPHKYAIFMKGEDRYLQTKVLWWEKWVLALAWRLV